jgi:hypothetical protein
MSQLKVVKRKSNFRQKSLPKRRGKQRKRVMLIKKIGLQSRINW